MKKHKYNIIYADPPWDYQRKAGQGVACKKYKTMSINDICNMDISAANNCALFIWATFPLLPEALQVIKAWGFEYKTQAFTWIKLNPKNYKPFFGIGYYTKSNAEVCLLGIKGKMKPIKNDISSVIIEPKREHSRKPDIVRKQIVRLFGDLPRIELFARDQKDGWDVFGNETNKFLDKQLSLV